ncbi:MAG: hypothetical protein E7578_03535 [Ruminococcaceae bacterium]|nr:hypothetical protein [Oscillospiraceae bacterium]
MAIKENSADLFQRQKLEREKELSQKSKICDLFITALFCVFIFGFAILHILIPDKEKSESENRVLEKFPEFSSESLFSGEYTSNMTKYLSDQFPFRDFFITVKASSENVLLRMENGGIMYGDDTLTARLDSPDTENLSVNLEAVKGFSTALENAGIPTVFAPAGRRVDVCLDDLPLSFGTYSQNELWSEIDRVGNELDCTYLNLRDPLMNKASTGEEVYFRTDHHWNTMGAYYAYSEIWHNLPESVTADVEFRKADSFTRETVTEDFLGTSFSSSGASWITPDKIELFRFEGDDTMPVTVMDTGETHKGLYYREYLDLRDKYSVFLGENHGRVDIGNKDRKTIVIIKDSFAQSVTPFFAADFDVILIDPRYTTGSIFRTVTEISPDAVVILMNADTLTSSAVLRPLMRGVKG